MKKRTLPFLMGLMLVPATMQAQQLKSEYIKWFPSETENTYPKLVNRWSKSNPQLTEDDNFFISRVKPKTRFRNQATQVNKELNASNDKRLIAWLPFNVPSVNALPNGVFDSEVFSMWQYVDHWGNWNCSLGRIPASLLDVAHKNGVPVTSVAGIPYGGLTNDWRFILQDFGKINVGNAADYMHYYGYDGLGYNSEYNDYSYGVTETVRRFHISLNREMKNRNPIFENMWYDGTNDDGIINFDRGLGSHNDANFGSAGSEAASLFFNYNWTSSYNNILAPSVTKAEQMGRNPLYLYAGVNMQGGEPRSGINWTFLKNYRISIGLWGAHAQNMFFEGRGELGSAADTKQRTYMLKTEQWFTGGTRNPAKLPRLRDDLNHSATNKDFPGMSSMMSARSPLSWNLSDEPFVTYFNLGNGKFFNWKGQRQHSKEWYNVGVQDYMPTWRWWFSSALLGTDVLTNGLQAEFIWDDAYMGGSCFRVHGSVANEYLQLFKTQYALQAGDVITVRYKLVGGSGKVNLVLTAKDNETVAINEDGHNLFTTAQQPDDEVWVEKTFTVGSELAGKELALVALHFSDATNMNLYFGEFSIVRGTSTTPAAPTVSSHKLYSFSNHGMDAKLIWSMPNDKPSGEPCYNTDVNTSLFKVYAQQEGGQPQLMGITTSWAAMLYSIPVDKNLNSTRMRLGVQAVSLDFKSESSITWTADYTAAPEYAYNDNIEISQQVLKPGEAFTIKYSDERHTAGSWQILDADGNVVKNSSADATNFTVSEGLSKVGNYTVKVVGDVVGADGVARRQTREFAGFVQVTAETIGAVPQINTLTANNETSTITVNENTTVNLAYTGRPADGSLSRGVNMKEMGMTFRAADASINTAVKEMAFSFWVKYNTIAAGNMQFFDIRDQGTIWPQNNWGVCWSTYDPATKELGFTIRNSNGGGDEHTQIWDVDIRTGVWYHFAIVFEQQGNGVRERIYVNGKEARPKSWKLGSVTGMGYIPHYQPATANWPNAYVMLGFGRHQCSAWDAVIDDVKFYNRKLSADDVKTAMNTSNTSDNVAAFWNFETNADSQHNFASQGTGIGTLQSLNMRRVTKVALAGEGRGEFFARAPEYEAGCPFVDGSSFSVTTTPEWRTRKAVITPAQGGNSQAGSATVSYGTAGDYNVTLILKNSHGSDTRTFSVIKVEGNTTGINGTEASEMLTYTVDKDIFVEFAQAGKYTVEVFNLQGGKVAGNTAQVVAGSQMNVHVGTAGVYVLKVMKDGKVVRTAKLLCK